MKIKVKIKCITRVFESPDRCIVEVSIARPHSPDKVIGEFMLHQGDSDELDLTEETALDGL